MIIIFKMLKTALRSVRMHRPRREGGVEGRARLQRPEKTCQKQSTGANRRVLLPSFVPREQCKKDLKPEFGLQDTSGGASLKQMGCCLEKHFTSQTASRAQIHFHAEVISNHN